MVRSHLWWRDPGLQAQKIFKEPEQPCGTVSPALCTAQHGRTLIYDKYSFLINIIAGISEYNFLKVMGVCRAFLTRFIQIKV